MRRFGRRNKLDDRIAVAAPLGRNEGIRVVGGYSAIQRILRCPAMREASPMKDGMKPEPTEPGLQG
jgi:hypothetical protein